VLGSSLRCRRLGRSLGENVGDEVLGVSLGNIESLRYVLESDDGIWLGDLLAEVLEGMLDRTLRNKVLGSSLRWRRLGRSLGDSLWSEVADISLGNIETLGYVLVPDDGVWLGALLVEIFGDTLSRTLGNKVLVI
jgi:hypothetical protein